MIDEAVIGDRYRLLVGGLDERGMRRWAAAEAVSLGRGGTAAVSRATGIAESTIRRGRRELACEERLAPGRVRRPGAGRKPLTETDPTLLGDLEALVDEGSRGDELYPDVVDGLEKQGGVPSRLLKTDAGGDRQEGTPWRMFAGSLSGRETRSRSRSMTWRARARVG